jgi:hypothetical protein
MSNYMKMVDGVPVQMTDAEIAERQAEEQAWIDALPQRQINDLRDARNKKLADTDWWVMPDRTATQAQLDYRQALRDITETYTSLDDVVWPEKPE